MIQTAKLLSNGAQKSYHYSRYKNILQTKLYEHLPILENHTFFIDKSHREMRIHPLGILREGFDGLLATLCLVVLLMGHGKLWKTGGSG